MKTSRVNLSFIFEDICHGDQAKLLVYLGRIKSGMNRYHDVIPELIREGDFEAIRTQSHTLKTYLKYISCDSGVHVMTAMEQFATKGDTANLRLTYTGQFAPIQLEVNTMLDREIRHLETGK